MGVKSHLITTVCAAAAALTATAAPAAFAVPHRASGSPAPQPPAHMSAVGGPRLGEQGVQVGAGAPALPKDLSALSWMVSDLDTGQVLASSNPHWPLPPASTLKTLFADTVLPRFAPDTLHKVTNADLAGMGEGSSLVGVMPGQTYKVSDLWLGVFLRSGNDAVHTLASMNGGVAKTVTDMQAEARSLGADDTHVVTPDGYDQDGQVSSAYDLTLFARAGLRNPDFAKYCSTARAQFPGGPSTKGKPFEIDNTNRLLSGTFGVTPYSGVVGVKNGYTTHAGNTLVVAARKNGHTIAATLMHPQDPRMDEVYEEGRALLDWGFSADGRGSAVGTLNQPAAASPPASDGIAANQAAAKVASNAGGMSALGWSGIAAGAVVALATAAAFGLRYGRTSGRRRGMMR